jgi:hypothetical protein
MLITPPGDRRDRCRSAPPAIPAAQRSARPRASRWCQLAIALVLTCGLGGCGAPLPPPAGVAQNLTNIAQIQTAIQDTLAARQHLRGTAYCPARVPALAGEVFSCVVAIPGHRPAIFTVTEVNSTGDVTYVGHR